MESADRDPSTPRRDDKAQVGALPPPVWENLWANPKELVVAVIFGFLGFIWGIQKLFAGDSGWERGVGVFGVAGGVLLWTSYLLGRLPGVMVGQRWSSTPARRVLRAVVSHAWWVLIPGLLALFWLADQVIE